MRFFLLSAFVVLTNMALCQQQLLRWSDRQSLQWDDFTGQANDTSSFAAESFAEICYSFRSENLKEFQFDVYAGFNKAASWSRKDRQCAELLKHEQTHFNIAAIFARRLQTAFENTVFGASYNQQILDIFSRNKLAYQAMQQQYDDETNHSLNKQKQKQWEDWIDEELKKTGPTLQLAVANERSKKNI